ncbi:transglutaminaseTgpA domain-containing protein [Sinomonas sp. JGH33]|uniref:TransglutaminaseTgpA domain-containing protein n=1 Tax=Sinomonas terricola TaxID=3110330 RepID=A0ABU5T9M3_9MICC|nr:transglutaminaseTgpA domain-containing protein [Sinomonas sp. JGH33]MEA5456392.1 transglutaminaseTgpA domain-containing protein [Sinomonas sp. JGH33]
MMTGALRQAGIGLLTSVSVVLALLPLYPVYSATEFWVALGGGVVLGTLLALAGARLRLGALNVAGLAVAAYFVFGGVFALRSASLFGAVPTVGVLQDLAIGVVRVWKDMLTAATPVAGIESLFIAPYLMGLLGALTAGSIAMRAKRPQWTALPVVVLLLTAITLGTYAALAPAAIGAVIAVVLLAWCVLGGRPRGLENLAETSTRRGRYAGAAGMLAIALAVGIGVGTIAPLPTDRAVLRDVIVPPLDVRDLPSPLTSFREFTTGGAAMKLFTVEGLPQGASVRLATLDQYDGIVYRVTGNGSAGSGQFSRVGRAISNPESGSSTTVTVTIDQLTGVWMPDAGYLSSLALGDGMPAERRGDLNYNAATGTAVLIGGLGQGDSYTAEAVLPRTPDDAQLAKVRIKSVSVPTPQSVPEIVSTLASQFTAGADTPWAQLHAIETKLHTTGFFSNGLEGQARSRAGHTSERISALLDGAQMVGDDEQYAVAMALMARSLGIPARVVMGFRPDHPAPGPVMITGADVHAWVEVPFDQVGWVAFDPTPPKDQVPKEEVPQHRQKPQPQIQQPPPPIVPPVQLPPAPPAKQAAQGPTQADLGVLWATLRWGGAGVGILALLLGPALAIAAAKARRRRGRQGATRAADRINGGWQELVDVVLDHGAPVPAGATRREQALALSERFPEHAVAPLAARADHAVFGHAEPSEAEIEAYWADVETATQRIRGSVGWRGRLRASYFAHSVLRDVRAELGRIRWRDRLPDRLRLFDVVRELRRKGPRP